MIYLIMGQSGSGKTSVRKHLERKGLVGFESSEYVRRAMEKYGAETVRELLEQAGKDVAAKLIHEKISELGENVQDIVISGFRVPSEVEYFRERFDIVSIGLYTCPLTSFRRISSGRRLARADDPNNFERFFREKICGDNLLGLSEIMRRCIDHLIVNEGTLDELFKKIDGVINSK